MRLEYLPEMCSTVFSKQDSQMISAVTEKHVISGDKHNTHSKTGGKGMSEQY